MYTFLLVVHIIVSLFLVFIILIQGSKGDGISEVFGGGGSSQTTIFGSRTGTFLTKATAASAILFMITSLSLAFLSTQQRGSSVIQQELQREQTEEQINQILPQEQEPATENVQPESREEAAPAASSDANPTTGTPAAEPEIKGSPSEEPLTDTGDLPQSAE